MPAMFGKTSRQNELIEKLDKEFIKIRQRHHLAPGDFPNLERFKQGLMLYKFEKFSNLKIQIIDKVDEVSVIIKKKKKKTKFIFNLLKFIRNMCFF